MRHEDMLKRFAKRLSDSIAAVMVQYGCGKVTDKQFELFWHQVGKTAMQAKHQVEELEKVEATTALGIDLSTFFEDNPNN